MSDSIYAWNLQASKVSFNETIQVNTGMEINYPGWILLLIIVGGILFILNGRIKDIYAKKALERNTIEWSRLTRTVRNARSDFGSQR